MANVDLRSRVEAVFRQRFPEHVARERRLARRGFAEMLVALGLQKSEADVFLEAWDPTRSPQLNYVEFLDFLFGPGADCPLDKVGVSGVSIDAHADAVIDAVGGQERVDDAEGREASLDGNVEPSIAAKEHAETDAAARSGSADESNDAADKPASAAKDKLDAEANTRPDEPGDSTNDGTHGRRPRQCAQCFARADVFLDATDSQWYCENCWVAYYGTLPSQGQPQAVTPEKLMSYSVTRLWTEEALYSGWRAAPMANWPPALPSSAPVASAAPTMRPGGDDNELWTGVRVRVVPDLVGTHARECTRRERPYVNEILAGRYRVSSCVGAGQFTRALLATDLTSGERVCVKRHNGITVELLSDLLAIARRLTTVDPTAEHFPRMFDAFFDMSGYTVETFIEGQNCLDVMRSDANHFGKADNLRIVAQGVLQGLALLAKAGVVHADVKADNILWTESQSPGASPRVRLVDFGCARLDRACENGRNWSLAEGGAGHLGKWAPEMILRLPITDRADVWGLGVVLLELHCGRFLWCCEEDSVEVVLAQVLGLIDARDGLPADLLRRSPLDITRLYTPGSQHFPVRRVHGSGGLLEEFRPVAWGLTALLGEKIEEPPWDAFAETVLAALTVDHDRRPSAEELLLQRFCADTSKPT